MEGIPMFLISTAFLEKFFNSSNDDDLLGDKEKVNEDLIEERNETHLCDPSP